MFSHFDGLIVIGHKNIHSHINVHTHKHEGALFLTLYGGFGIHILAQRAVFNGDFYIYSFVRAVKNKQ